MDCDGITYSKLLSCRVSPATYRQVAAVAGGNVSDWLRNVIEERLAHGTETPAWPSLRLIELPIEEGRWLICRLCSQGFKKKDPAGYLRHVNEHIAADLGAAGDD